ncbi:MAG: DUF2752 domain-containing protein [Cyclobacteriaceae bacterium]|nr:DUF2752 domain-containing protein [Cyclobacteriaceae bacterium]
MNIFFKNLELFIWVIALTGLAISDPSLNHFSLCPLNNMGFDFCPGCGLGHSIGFLFHGEFLQSFKSHPLGIFAIGMLFFRIYTLIKLAFHDIKKQSV